MLENRSGRERNDVITSFRFTSNNLTIKGNVRIITNSIRVICNRQRLTARKNNETMEVIRLFIS